MTKASTAFVTATVLLLLLVPLAPPFINTRAEAQLAYTGTLGGSTVTAVLFGPPTDLAANLVAPSEIDLSWTAPSDVGSMLLTGYQIERSTDGGNTWSTIVEDTGNTETTYADTGLEYGTTYTYRVSAINPVGTGSPSDTASATTTSATVSGIFWTCCYGLLKIHGILYNPVPEDNQFQVQLYAPNGQLIVDNTYTIGDGAQGWGFRFELGISRDQGKGNYVVVVTHHNEVVGRAEIPSWINNDPVVYVFAGESNDGGVGIGGRVANGIAGEQVSIDIIDPDGSTTATYTVSTSLHAQYSLYIDAASAASAFPTSGDYTIMVTHLPTGVTGSTILTYTRYEPFITGLAAQEMYEGSVNIYGRVEHGIGGEQVSIDIIDPNNSKTATYTRPIVYDSGRFSLFIDRTDAAQVFPTSGDYTIVATYLPTGVTGSVVFAYRVLS